MKKQIKENYLEKVPFKKENLNWSLGQDGKVTLEIQNRGIANRLAQLILKKPKISYIHLEEFGSFIWQLIDGKSNIITIGERVHEHFGDNAEPLYERLSKYFTILESNGFIGFN